MGNSGLSKFLIKDGLLSKQDCQIIIRESGHSSAAFAKGVVALGIFSEDGLAQYLCEKTRFPVIPRERLALASSRVMGVVDIPLLERLEVLPIELKGKTLVVAMADPLDPGVMQQLEFFLDYKIQPVITTTTAIHSTLRGVVSDFSAEKSSFQTLLDKHLRKASKPNEKKESKSRKKVEKKSEARNSDADYLMDDIVDPKLRPTPAAIDNPDTDFDGLGTTSSTDLDDFSSSDEDIDLDIVADSEDDDDFSSTMLTGKNGEESGPDLDFDGLGNLDPFNDPSLDDDGSATPAVMAPKKAEGSEAMQAKVINNDTMWGDDSEFDESEEAFGDIDSIDNADDKTSPKSSQHIPPTLNKVEPEDTPISLEDDDSLFDLGEASPAAASSDEFTIDDGDFASVSEDEVSFDDNMATTIQPEAKPSLNNSAFETNEDFDFEDTFEEKTEENFQMTFENEDSALDIQESDSPPSEQFSLEPKISHEYSVGHLNHALAQMGLTSSFEDAQNVAINALSCANINQGFIFVVKNKNVTPLLQWSQKDKKLTITKPEQKAVTASLIKFAAVPTTVTAWETLEVPMCKLGNYDTAKNSILALKTKHPKGALLVAISIWPNELSDGESLKDAAAALIKQLSKKLSPN